MKILRLRFKNLNSLVGTFNIDFTDEAYKRDGLFLISGPTGAGKSTILDAICLALFGRTPRLKIISANVNEIMSKGCGDCFSEVEFSSGNAIYRCSFSQRRARNKSTGALQAPQMELSKLENSSTDAQILENKIRKIESLIESLSGMNYERFTRSILLAQGEFAKFLQSKDDERASLLEQITGSEIYSQISIFTYNFYSSKKKAYEEKKALLAKYDLESDEEIAHKRQEQANCEEQKNTLSATLNTLSEKITYKTNLNDCESALDDNEKQQNQLQTEINIFAPKAHKLKRALDARELIPYVKALQESLESKNNCSLVIENLKNKELPQIIKDLEDKEKLTSTQKQKITEAQTKLNSLQKILPKVRSLDNEILLKKQSIDKAFEDNVDKKKDCAKKSSAYKKLKKQISNLAQDIHALQAEAQSAQSYGPWLLENLSSLKLRLNHLHSLPDDVASVEKNINKCLDKNTQLQKNLKNAHKNEAAAIEAIDKQTKERQQLVDDKTQLLDGESERYYCEKLNEYQNYNKFLDSYASLEDLRLELQPHKPCPLCGALIHPLCPDLPKRSDNDEKIKKIKDLLEDLNKLNNKLKNNESEHNILELKKENAQKDITSIKQQQSDNDEELKKFNEQKNSLIAEESKLRKTLSAEFKEHGLLKLNLDDKKLCTDLTEMLNKYQSNHQDTQDLIDKQKEYKSEQAQIFSSFKALSSVIRQNLKNIRQDKKDQELLIKERENLFDKQDTTQAENDAYNNLNQAQNDFNQHQGEITLLKNNESNMKKQIEREQERLESLEDQYKTNEANLKHKLSASGFSDIDDYQKALVDAALITKLQTEANELTQKEQKLQGAKESLEKRHQELLAQNLTTEELSNLQAQKKKLDADMNELNQNLGSLNRDLDEYERKVQARKQDLNELDLLKKDMERYEKLNALIGSADGKKFRNLAQGLTFEIMIHNANQQLMRMNDRYILVRDRSAPLSLNVIDAYEASTVRSTANLSGGESFIVSLALALGLAQMSKGKVQVDSLFLDEGFGTLDEKALNMALNSLAALHRENKLIGIISHVQELKNNISTQIVVERKGGSQSLIKGPGISYH